MNTTLAAHYKAPGRLTKSIVNPLITALVKLGVPLKGAGVLSVRGRTMGDWRSVSFNPLSFEGEQFLVAPRGETQWVKNMRAAGSGRPGRRPRWGPWLPAGRCHLRRWCPAPRA